jgi:GT2 family glycosyltransferase
LEYEVIVVDNASGDNVLALIKERFPQVKTIASNRNLGMGAGNNLGFTQASGRYLVVMNPDTVAQADTFQILFKAMEANPKIAALGPKQFNPDGSLQNSCYRYHRCLTPLFRRTRLGKTVVGQREINRFLMTDFDKQSNCEVDWLLGSFLFMRAGAFKQITGFDDRFFLYFEDTDLCRRFHLAGWQVVYLPEATIIHNHQRASARLPWYQALFSKTARQHLLSWFKYLVKYRGC